MKRFALFLSTLLILILPISIAQNLNILSFNQTQTAVIRGLASTTDQSTINSYLNFNGDSLTWDVSEIELPRREQKTVEYFIYQDMTQMAANTEKVGTFTVYIPEKNPIIKSAIIEIKNIVYNTQITSGSTVILGNETTNTTLLTTAAGPAATGENMVYVIIADATPAMSYIRSNGTYTFTLYVRLNPIRQAENAKLILTYEYDSDSPRQLKTVRFFIGQLTSSLAVGSSTSFIVPPLNLPENNVVIRDAFFETYIHLAPGGTVDEGISIDLDGSNAISGTPIDNAGATTIDYVFLYRNIFNPSTSHTFNFKPTAGYAIDTVGTELILTYEYDASSPTQIKTVKYLIGQDGGLYTSNHISNFQRRISLPEDNINIRSVYNRVSFAIAYGAGAGTTTYTTTIGVNSTILGNPPANQISYSLALRDEQVSTSMILYNATHLYNLKDEDIVICSVYSSAATTSYYTGSKGCELIITYVYNSSSSKRLRTVDYFVGQSYNSSLATSFSFPFSFQIPENSYVMNDAYLLVYGFTGSATAATNTLTSYVNVGGYVMQTCNFRNTGEARSDRCWDYVLDNVTSPGSYTAVLGSGVTRWYSSVLTITYTYQAYYQLSVEHNSTVSYSGILNSINVSINLTSTLEDEYTLYIYDFVRNEWVSCQKITVAPNSCYLISCEISVNPENYISSEGKIRVRLNTTVDSDKSTLKEEYVQFYIIERINQAPTLSNRVEYPQSPSSYSRGATYIFNITVNDVDGEYDIYAVIFEFNGINETVVNYEILNSTARVYWFVKNDLPANPSGYIFRWYASDRSGEWGNVVEGLYIINKAIPSIYISFSSNPINYPEEVNVTCEKIHGDYSAILKLFRNDTIVLQGYGNYISEKVRLGAGIWNYSCDYEESQNYTSHSLTNVYLQVNKGINVLNLVCFPSESVIYPTETTCTGIQNSIGDDDVVYYLYRDDTLVSSKTNENPSETILLGAGTYIYKFNSSEGANWTANSSGVNLVLVVNQNISTYLYMHLNIDGSEENREYTYPIITNVTAWFDVNSFVGPPPTFILLRNGEFVGNSSPISEVLELAAGYYNYTYYTLGNQNYSSAVKQLNLTIRKADIVPYLHISINGIEKDATYTYGNITNVTAWSDLRGQSGIVYNFYRETEFSSVFLGSGESVFDISLLGANTYLYVFNTTGNQNYTSGQITRILTILKKPTIIRLLINGTEENRTFLKESYANFTVELLEYAGRNVELWTNYSDGITKLWAAGPSPLQNITFLDVPGIYNFTAYYNGDENYTSSFDTKIVSVLYLNSRIESLEPKVIYEGENSTLIGVCECIGGTCRNVYIEALADDIPIPNEPGYNLQINGSSSYYLGDLENSLIKVSWKITGWKFGEYRIKVKCNSSETGEVFSREEILKVKDAEAPIWFNNFTDPISPTVYEPDKNYIFGISWYDNAEISTVLIEHNFTREGMFVNNTMSKVGEYYIFSVKDLPAGVYFWKVYASDTSDNWNYTDGWIYVVEKKPTEIKLLLNGSEGDKTYNVHDVANFTVVLNVLNKIVYLETNISGWITQYGVTPLYNYTLLTQIGIFNVTGYFLGDENYTSSKKTYLINVIDSENPKWSALGQNSSWIGVGKPILLFARWDDNYYLDYAWLETNETGRWENKTAVKLGLSAGGTWSNFTWQNYSVPAGWIIAWRIYANDTSGNENVTETMFFFVNASEMWKYTTGSIIISSSAVGNIDDDSSIDVVFGSFDKNVYALRGSDGNLLWKFSTQGQISSSPALASISSERYLDIFIGSFDKNIYAINGSDGTKIWNFTTGGRISSSPAISDVNKDGILDVVVGSEDGKVYALNGTNGNLIWSFQTNGRVVSSPAIINLTPEGYPVVFVGSHDFNIYAINGSDGTKIWNFSAKEKIESSPAVDDLNGDGTLEVVFGSYDNKIYVLNAETGEEIWNYTTGNWITSSPVILKVENRKKIVISSHDSNVYCFNDDGTLNWTFKVLTGGRAPYLPSLADFNFDGVDDVVVGATDGRIYVLNGINGNLIWFYHVGQYIYSSPALVDLDGNGNIDLVFGSLDRNQYALDPPSWPTFGGNNRRTRILDVYPPELIKIETIREQGIIKINTLWKEKFSNLAYAIIEENSTGKITRKEIKLKGTHDWVNYTFLDKGFYYSIKVFDEYGNFEEISDFINREIFDEFPPFWSIDRQTLSFNYSKNKVYPINISWIDDSYLDNVIIEHNFTGSFLNESMNKMESVYQYLAKDLSAGTYVWKSYAIDAFGNWNSTPYFIVEIRKAVPEVEFSVKEKIIYPDKTDVRCVLVNGDENGDLVLTRNDEIISSGKSIYEQERLSTGLWHYSCTYQETQNYSSIRLEREVEVIKGEPKLNFLIEHQVNDCPARVKIIAFEENEGDEDVLYRLYNSTSLIGEGSYIEYEEIVGVGANYFVYNSTEGQNWTSARSYKFIFVNDSSAPENLIIGRKYRRDSGLSIYSLWRENCSSLSHAFITENSTGQPRKSKVIMKGKLDWANYTISKEDLRSINGCEIVSGFICRKKILISIEAFDIHGNSARKDLIYRYSFVLNPFYRIRISR